ncbi:MAG TPA: ribosomal protein S18-alanine N-acetyltransferase [Microbacteriaceae bacterium]
MSDDWQLRRATSADLDAIMALETSTFATDAWSRSTMRGELASEHGYYLVAVRSGEADAAIQDAAASRSSAPRPSVDGYAGLLAPRGAAEADIQTIAVAPRARRHGIGRALVAALIAEAVERGVRDVFLEVRADNPGAQALYRSLGFEEIGVRPHYYQPDGVDALVMKLAFDSAHGPSVTGGEQL